MGRRDVEVEPGVRVRVFDEGAGPAVVLLAGWGFSHAVWDAQIRMLGGAGHRVVAIDLRGHGGSDAPFSGYDLDRLATDVALVLTRLDVRDATLVGWSLGGSVAFRLAATCRERIGRLVLVASNGVRASRTEAFPFGPDADAVLGTLVAGETGRRPRHRRSTIGRGFHAAPGNELLDWLVADSFATPSWSGVACLRALFLTDQLELLPRVRDLEVVQIAGDADALCPLDGARWLQDRLDRGRLHVLDACGHYPMFEHPQAFDDLLGSVLAAPTPT